MEKNYEIVLEFVKDISSETKNAETFIFVKENLKRYNLNIDINSLALKNQLIEVNTKLTFDDKSENENKSFFFINYATIIKINNMDDRKVVEKIILCDLQNEIYPRVEKAFLDVLKVSGFKELEIETKINFEKLYKEKFN
ncbi:MAG: protein-export chaperone SecB [Candidatus Pelagibacter sp.]|tara:strand:- start:76 stop:495 length:420 start_codon:yes stop_codon:yes gene_type:complete